MDAFLPDEVWLHIFTFAAAEDWIKAGVHRTCRRFAALLRDERLWREWCDRSAGVARIGEEPWRDAYARWFERGRAYRAAVDMGQNLFVTGGAGVGKSHVLKETVLRLQDRGCCVAVTAATGIAALQIGGVTLCSFAGTGPEVGGRERMINRAFASSHVCRRWKKTRVLVVDEISMISSTYLEVIDALARRVRGICLPFGGIQVIFFGDFFQLPPVAVAVSRGAAPYCFESDTWHNAIQKTIELKSTVRQAHGAFSELLGRVRTARLTSEDASLLRSRVGATLSMPEGVEPTRLFPYKAGANAVNRARLSKLKTEERTYEGLEGRETYTRSTYVVERAARAARALGDNCPAPRELSLKVGAQVMLVANVSPREGLVNGSVGKVTGFAPVTHLPLITFSNGVRARIELWKWMNEDPGGEWAVAYAQLPLILAWAVTIHKCQGTTLDAAEMDLGNVFEDGQAYVALSRLRSLDGLRLLSFDSKRIRANPRVVEYYRNMNAARDDSGSEERKRKLESEADKHILACSSKRARVPDEYCHK